MFVTLIRSILGPFVVILDYFLTHPERLSILLVIWAGIYILGLVQLKRIEAQTAALVLRESAVYLREDPQMKADDLYKRIFPVWAEEFSRWKYLFIPHRNDLWPVRVTAERVIAKMPFSPEWLETTLEKNGARHHA